MLVVMVRVVRLRVVLRMVRLLVVATLVLRAADNLLDDLHAAIVLGLLLGVVLEVLGSDQGGEEEAVEGFTDGMGAASVDRALLFHNLHLVLLAVHTADKLVNEGLHLSVGGRVSKNTEVLT